MRRLFDPVHLLCAALLLPGAASPARAQVAPCDRVFRAGGLTGVLAEYARMVEVTGAASERTGLFRRTSESADLAMCGDEAAAPDPWRQRAFRPRPLDLPYGAELSLLPVSSVSGYNSAYPSDRNNGVLWAGKGLSGAIAGGARLRWGPLSAAFAPTLTYQQNADFAVVPPRADLAVYSRYNYPGYPTRIDWPQRFGEEAFTKLDLGQSYVRVDGMGVAAGFSWENIWWGPANVNPVLLSNTAGGFPHGFVGTSGPVDIRIGRLELDAFWGRLTESDYFDEVPTNKRRLLAGLGVGFEPAGLDGLELGAARMYLRALPPEGLTLEQYVFDPYRALGLNIGPDNELLAIYGRWTLRESGLEAYFELAREDHWLGLDDLAGEPGYSQGYVLGAQKALRIGADALRLYGEVMRVQNRIPYRSARDMAVFYIHNQVRQGHTHRGQLLGASVGPGGGGDWVGADFIAAWGLAGGYVGRTAYGDDALYERYILHGRTGGLDYRDRETTLGVRGVYFLGDLALSGSAAWNRRANRNFLPLERGTLPSNETNWALELGAQWWPAGMGIGRASASPSAADAEAPR